MAAAGPGKTIATGNVPTRRKPTSTGAAASECVRASVLDAFSNNYRVTVVEDGCFDRSQASHAINLCDMNAKYADVVKTSEVLEFFDTVPPDQFDLPKGAPVEKHPSKR